MRKAADLKKETLSLFKLLPWQKRLYVVLRFLTCPFQEIAEFVPDSGTVLDLGSGMGIFSFYLSKKYPGLSIKSFDYNQSRIAVCTEIALKNSISNLSFSAGNIVSQDFSDSADCILLNDVFYQSSLADKKKIIEKCLEKLNSNGYLIIKEVAKKPLIKYWFCYFQEVFVAKVLGLNQGLVNILSVSEMLDLLGQYKVSVSVTLLDRGYFYPHIVYSIKKR